jgi:hypothetical protein
MLMSVHLTVSSFAFHTVPDRQRKGYTVLIASLLFEAAIVAGDRKIKVHHRVAFN